MVRRKKLGKNIKKSLKKLGIPALLKSSVTLYVVLLIAIGLVLMYLSEKDYNSLMVLIATGVLAVVRTKNSMGMNLDIFDEDDEIEDDKDSHDDKHSLDQDEAQVGDGEDESIKPDKAPISAPEPKQRVTPTQSAPHKRRKKATASRDGPITAVKRKRLDGGDQVVATKKRTTSKKKVVVKKSAVPKTRRVVTQSDKMDDESPGE